MPLPSLTFEIKRRTASGSQVVLIYQNDIKTKNPVSNETGFYIKGGGSIKDLILRGRLPVAVRYANFSLPMHINLK